MYFFIPPPPSERAQRLARELNRTLDQFLRANPQTSRAEIRQALRLAGTQIGAGRASVVMLAIGLAVAVAAGLAFALFVRGR